MTQWFSSITMIQAVVLVFISKVEMKCWHLSLCKEISGWIFASLGPIYFWHAYLMSFESFIQLHFILLPQIIVAMDEWRNDHEKFGERTWGNNSLLTVPKGPISHSVHLACGLCNMICCWLFTLWHWDNVRYVIWCCSYLCLDHCASYEKTPYSSLFHIPFHLRSIGKLHRDFNKCGHLKLISVLIRGIFCVPKHKVWTQLPGCGWLSWQHYCSRWRNCKLPWFWSQQSLQMTREWIDEAMQ